MDDFRGRVANPGGAINPVHTLVPRVVAAETANPERKAQAGGANTSTPTGGHVVGPVPEARVAALKRSLPAGVVDPARIEAPARLLDTSLHDNPNR